MPDVEYIQSLGEDRLYSATRAYLAFLQGYFKENKPGMFRWTQSSQETEIVITGKSPIESTIIEKMPVIIAYRTAGRWMGTALDQRKLDTFFGGDAIHTDMIPCSMMLVCIDHTDTVAQNIAWTVFKALAVFKQTLQAFGNIDRINPSSIGPVLDAGQFVTAAQPGQFSMVIVTSPFLIQEDTLIRENKESYYNRVKRVEMHMKDVLMTDFIV